MQTEPSTTQPEGWGSVPHVADISGTREAPAPQAAPAHVPASGRRRRMRRGALVGLVAGGAAVVLLAVAGGVGYAVGTSSHAPEHQVEAFLDDLQAGKVDRALRDAGIEHGKDDVLLTDAAYAKATSRITGYRIAATETTDDSATVGAYLTQGGRQVPATFTLERTGTDWGVFPEWELEAPDLGAVDVVVQAPAGTTVTVAGQRVTTGKGGDVTLRALPGSYDVGVDGGKWFTADTQRAEVQGFRTGDSTPVTMTTTLTADGTTAATNAVNAWVDGCVASTSTAPDGCSFYAYGENPANTYTNQKWTLDARPTVRVDGWLSDGWMVTTSSLGSATFTADFTGPAGSGRATAGPINVNATGIITGFSDAGATFRSAVGNGSSDTGS
ncbi:hypothetical protein [Curtobacterium sp. 9128]|uniref:hypothetical protein n=1 Tax=Curtobacterium sp. 9128 TaxID=1793722 RepID=UPI0011A0198D|nr:hypothetical protein [Curtobacterium sp. 9128]